MLNEERRVRELKEDVRRGTQTGRKLTLLPDGRFVETGSGRDPDRPIDADPEDLGFGCRTKGGAG